MAAPSILPATVRLSGQGRRLVGYLIDVAIWLALQVVATVALFAAFLLYFAGGDKDESGADTTSGWSSCLSSSESGR